ncbi:MAG: aminopeptidase [Erysipelotrichaceae bacterium]|nr:aminopeptidase [Erysipelotrichaceae bacterium]
MEKKTIWETADENKLAAIKNFAEEYKDFMSVAKTEREFVSNGIMVAEEAGFKNILTFDTLKPGDKVYVDNRGKNLCLFVIGTDNMVQGVNFLGAHIDSPRLDLKPTPMYEEGGLCLLQTHYYGGIKKYQWVAMPLALHGVVCKKDGSTVEIVIGEDLDDPVVEISDLLPHFGAEQMKKTASAVIEAEDMNVLVGSIPSSEEKEPVKKYILSLLKEKYDIEEDDFNSAELEIVPAGRARDCGIDRSMVMCYGQDDRACAYTSFRAILSVELPKRTACCMLVDKEEIGSIGNTGMESRFFENTIAEVLDRLGMYSELNVRRCLSHSKVISSDVAVGFDPNYPSISSKDNTAYFGKGLVMEKYTGSRGKYSATDANAEYLAQIRKCMDDQNIVYQFAELGKIDAGGGGTIAYIVANLNMEVIDAGIPVQNMHAPFEVTSKADVYEAYLGYKAFLEYMN